MKKILSIVPFFYKYKLEDLKKKKDFEQRGKFLNTW